MLWVSNFSIGDLVVLKSGSMRMCVEVVDGDMISLIQKIYDRSFSMNTKDLVEFHKRMIDEVDTFKILRFET